MAAREKQISRTNQLITDLNTAVQKAEELNSKLAQNISDSKEYFEDIKEYQTKIKEMTADTLSVSMSKERAFKEAPRVPMAFTNIPKPIKLEFEKMAKEHGLNLKEYLYFCLRAGGCNIPEASKIDARRR